MRFAALCLAWAMAALPAWAQGDGLAGNWKATILEDNQFASFWLLHFEGSGEKLTGSVTSLKAIPPTKISAIEAKGDLLTFGLTLQNGIKFSFEGKMPRAGAKKIYGTIARGVGSIPVTLELTVAKNQYELNREMVLRTPSDPRVFAATLDLINEAKKEKVAAKDLQEWVETALQSTDAYGPRWQTDFSIKATEALSKNEFYDQAATVGQSLLKQLDAKTPADAQLRILGVVGEALGKAGRKEEATALLAKADKLEMQAYKEHADKGLGYKSEAFKGRKGKSNRAVLVELFTGAQCPPCVAADMAFDGLETTYKEADVVLLQYHLHVPAPDALTNAESEARAEYYGKAVRGTPSTLINGKPSAPGGGGPDEAAEKYSEYRAAIEPLLEKEAGVSLKLSAVRKEGKIDIQVGVQSEAKLGEKTKLRVVVVEDWVRYRGRNGLTYHHRVVRAMPGGAEGFAVADQKVSVDVSELRAKLSRYLDNFEKNEDPFPDAQRPMRLRDLHVVAFIQDDATNEVLQAASLPVKE
ncbi:MAG: hypothetical protein K2X38_22505 [Gemmataceae bacterium]|nr:hypothetical protein [Gemmataceae bacterium]